MDDQRTEMGMNTTHAGSLRSTCAGTATVRRETGDHMCEESSSDTADAADTTAAGTTGTGRRRLLRKFGKLDGDHILESMRRMMTYDYLHSKIGDVDKTIASSIAFPLLNFKIAVATRVVMNATGVIVTCSGAFNLLGISLAGSGKLTSDGGLEELDFEGSGEVDLGVAYIPKLSGMIIMTYQNGVASLSMATSCTPGWRAAVWHCRLFDGRASSRASRWRGHWPILASQMA